ncbi:DinB superfamily protein [Pelagirhabdus alkalitolerans]|uniref:DinB superfamily protein n=1 Tax=Pelagirhabdus alkalitolerans TaxID=1612202 RepID=A0A1G6GP95_9BACI|nr:DinB family protein [Pelagirhabdus alkalitolerans]SDB83830.1 DinB superfamily protein [Pelagirhabdus alkalitolerans]
MTNHDLVDNIKFQFSISKQLLDYHLSSLEQTEYMWQPPKGSLYIKEIEGEWYAELPETESYHIGPPSIAWTLWHITYWWEMVFDYSFGDGDLTKDDIKVSNDVSEVKDHIYSLVNRWEEKLLQLTNEEFNSKQFSKFPFNNDVEFHKLASWLNLELMKNASEIGYARFDYATR